MVGVMIAILNGAVVCAAVVGAEVVSAAVVCAAVVGAAVVSAAVVRAAVVCAAVVGAAVVGAAVGWCDDWCTVGCSGSAAVLGTTVCARSNSCSSSSCSRVGTTVAAAGDVTS